MRLNGSLMPLPELQQRLHDRDRDFRDESVPADRLRLDERSGELCFVGRTFGSSWSHPLQQHALDQIAARLSIPAGYLHRCPPELRAKNVNFWVAQQQEQDLLVRFDRDEVRAIVSRRYVPVSNAELVDRIAERLDDPPSIRVRYEMTPERFVSQMLLEPLDSHGLLVGDVISAGLHVANSEVGLAPVSMGAMVYRLVCTNGLIAPKALSSWKRRHVTRPERLWAELDERVNHARIDGRLLKARFIAAQDVTIGDPPAHLRAVADQNGFSELERQELTQAFAREPGVTLYNLINAITRAGNAATLSLESREQLQRLGGEILHQELTRAA